MGKYRKKYYFIIYIKKKGLLSLCTNVILLHLKL